MRGGARGQGLEGVASSDVQQARYGESQVDTSW